MALSSSPVLDEAYAILTRDAAKKTKNRMEFTIHSPAGDLKVIKVISERCLSDYVSGNFADERQIMAMVSPGQFEKIVYAHKNNLTATVTEIATATSGDSATANSDVVQETKRYRAVLNATSSATEEGSEQSDESYDAMDLKSVRTVTFDLIDPGIEQIRTIQTSGIFYNTTTANLLKVLSAHLLKNIKVDTNSLIFGVDVAPGFVTDVRGQIAIPGVQRLVDLGHWVQRYGSGVYTTGFGRYFHNQTLYYYPTFSTRNFSRVKRKLTILNLPDNMMRNVESTWTDDDGHIYVASTGDKLGYNDTLAQLMNEGNGVRYVNADRLLNGFVETGGNKAVIDRSKNVSEFLVTKMEDGIEWAPMSEEPITINHAFQSSRIASRLGSVMQVGWESSKPSLITPGMPVRFLMPMEDRVIERYGTVLAVESDKKADTSSVSDSLVTSYSAVSIFLGAEQDKGAPR